MDIPLFNYSEEVEQVWKRYRDKPSRFQAIIIAASSNPALPLDDYNIAMEEWVVSNEVDGYSDTCICSQEIRRNYHYENVKTGQVIVVGSECIKKFGTEEQNSILNIVQRRENYTGEKLMCCSCCLHKVNRRPRAVPLCETCIKEELLLPSSDYLTVFGVLCLVCKKNRVMPGLITCCRKCKQYDCDTCGAPLHDTTVGMNVEERYRLCPYCAIVDELSSYCEECRIPLSGEVMKRGWTKCSDCYQEKIRRQREKTREIRKRQAENRSCSECRVLLPTTHEEHWSRCDSCQKKLNDAKYGRRVVGPMKICATCSQLKEHKSMEDWCKKCFDCHYGRVR